MTRFSIFLATGFFVISAVSCTAIKNAAQNVQTAVSEPFYLNLKKDSVGNVTENDFVTKEQGHFHRTLPLSAMASTNLGFFVEKSRAYQLIDSGKVSRGEISVLLKTDILYLDQFAADTISAFFNAEIEYVDWYNAYTNAVDSITLSQIGEFTLKLQ